MPLDADDVEYVGLGFVSLAELAAERGTDLAGVDAAVAARRLPKPAYVLPDGTEYVARDYFDSVAQADPEADFRARFLAAGGDPADADDEWEAYLGGRYAVCLLAVTPEQIVRKGQLMRAIEELLATPAPGDAEWRESLRSAVGSLDAIERPFARYDRERFGGPVSRDRLVAAVHERYPEAFAAAAPL
jgi:hypothetical protein